MVRAIKDEDVGGLLVFVEMGWGEEKIMECPGRMTNSLNVLKATIEEARRLKMMAEDEWQLTELGKQYLCAMRPHERLAIYLSAYCREAP